MAEKNLSEQEEFEEKVENDNDLSVLKSSAETYNSLLDDIQKDPNDLDSYSSLISCIEDLRRQNSRMPSKKKEDAKKILDVDALTDDFLNYVICAFKKQLKDSQPP